MIKELVFYILLFTLGMTLFFGALAYAEEHLNLPWNNYDPLKYEWKQDICELTQEEPYYDCRYTWLVVKINANGFLIPQTNNTVHAIGYWGSIPSKYVDIPEEDNTKYSALIVIGKNYDDNCYNYACNPIFWHEAKHIWCMCNWHAGMKTANELDRQLDNLGFI